MGAIGHQVIKHNRNRIPRLCTLNIKRSRLRIAALCHLLARHIPATCTNRSGRNRIATGNGQNRIVRPDSRVIMRGGKVVMCHKYS